MFGKTNLLAETYRGYHSAMLEAEIEAMRAKREMVKFITTVSIVGAALGIAVTVIQWVF
jgi:ABC-type lipoprotein release transport system permease subunit